MNNAEYKRIIERQHILYKKYKPVYCPHLRNGMTTFNRHGFNHLLRKGKKLRPRKETLQRFGLLPLASKIISSEKSTLEHRIEQNEKETIKYWGLTLNIERRKIRVVIRQINEGPKHFYSIMLHDDE